MNKTMTKPLVTLLIVNFIWGFDFIAIEYMMALVPPHIFTLVRLAIGSFVLYAAVWIRRGGLRIKKEDMPKVLVAGGVGMALYFTIENLGTGLTSASFSSLMMATVPIFGMIGDRLIYGNKITPMKVVCILISILGVYMLVSGEPMGISGIGFVAMIISAILWAFFIVYTKTLFEKYDLLTLLTGIFLAGLIVQIPIAVITQGITHAPINVTTTGIIVTVVTAVGIIVIGEFLYVYAIGNLSPTVTSAFENVLPITAVVFSFVIFGKMLTVPQLIGGVLIMASVTGITFIESRRDSSAAAIELEQ